MSSKPPTPLEIVGSPAFWPFESNLRSCLLAVPDQIHHLYPCHLGRPERERKRLALDDLKLVATLERFEISKPVQILWPPVVGDEPVASIDVRGDAAIDFEQIASLLSKRVRAMKARVLRLYSIRERFVSNFIAAGREVDLGLTDGQEVPHAQLPLLLNASTLTVAINITEIFLRLRRRAAVDPLSLGLPAHNFEVCSTGRLGMINTRPYALLKCSTRTTDDRFQIVGTGLDARALRRIYDSARLHEPSPEMLTGPNGRSSVKLDIW